MTQYDPRQYPNWYPQQQSNPLGYAAADPYAQRVPGAGMGMCKAAAIAQSVLACLILVCGCCAGFYGIAFSMDFQGLSAEQLDQLEQFKSELGEQGVRSLLFDGCGMVFGGVLQFAFVWWVWRGRRWAIWASIGAAALVALMGLGIVVYCMAYSLPFGLCFNIVVIVLQIVLVLLLGFALRESAALEAARAAYEAQWQQYYQYQAMYQQQVPGQVIPPPAPTEPTPPAAGPPTPPASEERPGGNPPPG